MNRTIISAVFSASLAASVPFGVGVAEESPSDAISAAEGGMKAMQERAARDLADPSLGALADQEERAERLPPTDDPLPAVGVPKIDVEKMQASQRDTMSAFLDRIESGELALPDRGDVRDLADGGIRLVAFASFAMPDESLERLIVEVNKAGGTVLMQGLHENDWQATTKKVREIVGLNRAFEYKIDPRLFVTLGIESVPTYALIEKPQSILENQCTKGMGVCQAGDTQLPAVTVAGDVSLDYAMRAMERRSRSPAWQEAAASIRARIEEGGER